MTAQETPFGELHVELPSGRRLQVVVDGDPRGIAVIVHHGTPSGAVFDPGWVSDAHERGLRLVGYARPGYGTSSRHPGRAVSEAAADVAAIADALGDERFLTWGGSGGGPHTLACAALLPDRVVAAATLASVAPYDAEGLDFMAGMGEGNIEEFGLVVSGGEEAIRPFVEQQLTGLLQVDIDELVNEMAPFVTEVDAEVLRGPYAATMLAQMRDGARSGPDGWIDDDLAFARPWGFSLADIRVPVQLWQGREDAMVPFGHGAWLAEQIAGVDARLTETDGHLTLFTHRVPEVHQWLREQWDAAS